MIVADASIIVPLVVLRHERGAASEALMRRRPDWISPPLWRIEVLNSLAKYMRFKDMPLVDAELAFKRAESFVTETPFIPDARILGLVAEAGCSAYDAEYAALAIQTGTPLVSNDRRLVAAFRRFALTPEELMAA